MSTQGITRREMMGLGFGAGAGLAAAAALPLTAAAAPATNHLAGWSAFPQDLGPTVPSLTYVNFDATAFHSYSYLNTDGRYLDDISGVGSPQPPKRLAAPLALPVGSVIHQINVAYMGTPIVEVFKRDFVTDTQSWSPEFQQTTLANNAGGPRTITLDLATPVTIAPACSYSLQFFASAGDSVYGMTVGYVPPTAGFVPFSGPTPRVLDTRESGDKLTFQEEITLNLGNPGVRGALFNLTVTETENGGFVAAFASNIAYPGNSSVNYTATGQTVANGVVCGVAPDGTIKLRGGGPAGACHVIVDRLGWFL